MNTLIEHKTNHKCSSLKISDMEKTLKTLQTHNLRKIYDLIWQTVDNDFVHGNRDFQKIDELVGTIEGFGISHESLRYYSLKQLGTNELLSNQRWVNLKKLKSIFNDAINFIMNSIHSKDFIFCECGDIKQKELKELRYIKDLLESFYQKHGEFKSIHGNDINGLPTPERILDYGEFKRGMKLSLEDLVDNTLHLMSRGIMFGSSSPASVPNLSYFQAWSKEDNIRHFLEKYHHSSDAIQKLTKHIGYIELKISQRNKAER